MASEGIKTIRVHIACNWRGRQRKRGRTVKVEERVLIVRWVDSRPEGSASSGADPLSRVSGMGAVPEAEIAPRRIRAVEAAAGGEE